MTRRALNVVAIALALSSVAANCEQCQPVAEPRIGNVDRTTDTVLVTGTDGHAYLVSAHPELEHLRVLDLTTERFVDAPNRFFPTSVPVGPATRRLAAAPGDGTRVYALDAALDLVQVVRTVDDEGPAFSRVGEGIDTGRAPADLAAWRDLASSPEVVELWVSLPDATPTAGAVQLLDAITGAELARVDLPDGARPDQVEVEPTGARVVVTDAALPTVHVIDRALRTLERDVDVGGASAAVAVGVIDVGDGLAPVALIGRRDRAEVALVRLYREGFREEGAALYGRTELPSLPMTLYVPDHRDSVTVCCRGLSDEAVDAGEATDAWGAAATASGDLLYLALAAPTGDATRRLVRLIDDDLEGLGGAVDLNNEEAIWVPVAGGEDRRPTGVTLTAQDTWGTPPLVELVAATETPLLTWEGALPGLDAVGGDYQLGEVIADVDVQALGARVGDVVVFTIEDPPPGCADRTLEAAITTITGATFAVVRGVDGLDEGDENCIRSGGGVTVAVLAAAAFVVELADGTSPGRLNLVDADPENVLLLPGAALTMKAAAAGLPLRGSMLSLPLRPHVTAMGLALSKAKSSRGDGGFGSAGLVPTAIVGGEMDIPDKATGGIRRARRMVVGTGSPDSQSGLFELIVCDEAETTPSLCSVFR
ncbi:MAG: hypothetical protein HYS27_20680 [Deltaproteobacteria bacterium]|nr:hypothetical protein [Deltaproteobacteria bacterium]